MQAGSQPVASTSATPASQPSHLIDEHALFGSSPSPTNNGNNVDLPPPSRNASGASLLGSPPSKAQRREQIFLARIHDFFVRTGREEVANVMARTLPELAIKRNAATRKPQRQPTLEDDAAAEGGKTTNGPDTSSTMVDPLFEAGDNAQTPFSSPPSATQSPILMPNDYANGDGSKGYLWDWYNIVEDEADRAKTMVAERVAASMNSGQRLLQQQQMPVRMPPYLILTPTVLNSSHRCPTLRCPCRFRRISAVKLSSLDKPRPMLKLNKLPPCKPPSTVTATHRRRMRATDAPLLLSKATSRCPCRLLRQLVPFPLKLNTPTLPASRLSSFSLQRSRPMRRDWRQLKCKRGRIRPCSNAPSARCRSRRGYDRPQLLPLRTS